MCDVCACDVCVFVCLYIFMILGANTYIRHKGIGPNDFVVVVFNHGYDSTRRDRSLITDTTKTCWLGNIIPVLKGDIASSESPESGATTTHLTSLVVPTSVDTSTTLENIGARYVLSRSINKLIYVLLKLSVPL